MFSGSTGGTCESLIKRKRRLEQLIPANNPTLSRVLAVEEHGP
jgi:hypothetical protein